MAYTVEDLLSVLHPYYPIKVDALRKNRRRVEHGLTTVGLKIHCLGDNRELLNLIKVLGGPRLENEKRSQWWRRGTSDHPGILAETNALLRYYRAELLAESGRLLQEGAT